MWLAHEVRVDHEALSDFRRRFRKELKGIFKQTVQLAKRMGLVGMELGAIDGTKIAADAARRAQTEESLGKALENLDERIEKMLTEKS